MNRINEPITFVVKQEDIATLLSEMKLTCNQGSSFYSIAAGSSANNGIKPMYKELILDKEFYLAMCIVAQPDLYVRMRSAGVKGISKTRLHKSNSEGGIVVLTEQGEGDDIIITMFDNYKSFLHKWAHKFIGSVEAPVANYIPPELGLEEFMLILHTIDSYRRVTYHNLLDHVYIEKAYVKISEFTRTMAESLIKLDIRWLLPAFMAVTPGIEQYITNMEAKNLGILMTHNFFAEGLLGSGEEVLVFAEAGQVMGLEFLHSWLISFGFEINIAFGNGFKTVERFFVAPTILTNHFVRLRDLQGGKAMVNHQTYVSEQLMSKMDELFVKALTLKIMPTPTAQTVVPLAQAAPPLPIAKFCRNCGTKLADSAVFCVNCGTKII